MVQVMVVDDSEIVRRGLSDVIESCDDLHVVAEAWDGRSAVDAARRYSPDVALVDIRMPGMDGIKATQELHSLPFPPRVIILTTFSEDEYVDEAVRAGAVGFLLKETPPQELIRAVRDVAQGKATLDPAVTRRVLTTLARQSPSLTPREKSALESLNERELEVLRLVGRGLSNAEIGKSVYVTEGTVKAQVSRLLTKLGLSNRVQAARLAYRAGLEH